MYVHMLIHIVWKLKRCTIFRVMGMEDERSILVFSLQSTWVTEQQKFRLAGYVEVNSRTIIFSAVC